MCQTGNQTQLNFTSHGILISCHKIMVFAPLQNHFVTLMAIRKHSTTVSHEDKVHFDPIRTYEGICWEYKYPQTYFECLANNYKGGLFKLFKLNINRDHKFLPNFRYLSQEFKMRWPWCRIFRLSGNRFIKKKTLFFDFFWYQCHFMSHSKISFSSCGALCSLLRKVWHTKNDRSLTATRYQNGNDFMDIEI